MTRPALALVLALVLAPGTLSAAKPTTAKPPAPATAASRASALRCVLDAGLSPHASWSITVLDAKSGETLCSLDPERALVPASTMKLLTALAALRELGPATRLVTRLEARGTLRDGVLDGDLVVVGGADPSLGTTEAAGALAAPALLATLVDAVRQAGIRRVTGAVVADATLLPDDRPVPRWALWEDVGNYYGAVTTGLPWRACEAHVLLDSGPTPGDPASVARVVTPHAGLGELDCRVRAGAPGSGDDAYVLGGPFAARRLIVGTVPPGRRGFRIRAALPDPPLTMVQELRDACAAAGVTVSKATRLPGASPSSPSPPPLPLLDLPGPTVRALVAHMLATSDNVTAEHLLALVGRKSGPGHGFDDGVAAVRSLLAALHVRATGLDMRDGSGLSRACALTSALLASTLLRAAATTEGAILRDDLPRAGADRSLDRRLPAPKLRGRLRAKTGSMEGVWALAGFLRTTSGRDEAFAIILNDPVTPGRSMGRVVESLLLHMTEW